MRLRPRTSLALQEGRALFDAHRFWEAHEAWEAAWRVEQGDIRLLLHGLIQLAAGCHHAFVTGRAAGAVKLLASGLEKLAAVPDGPDGPGGLALGRFRSGVSQMLAAARLWERGDIATMDRSVVPHLENE
jgi:predicted metal-dependent hydrolase